MFSADYIHKSQDAQNWNLENLKLMEIFQI